MLYAAINKVFYRLKIIGITSLLSLFAMSSSALEVKTWYFCSDEECAEFSEKDKQRLENGNYSLWKITAYKKTFTNEAFFEAETYSSPLVYYIETDKYDTMRARLSFYCRNNDVFGKSFNISLTDPEQLYYDPKIESEASERSKTLSEEAEAEIIPLLYKIDDGNIKIAYSMFWAEPMEPLTEANFTELPEDESKRLLGELFGAKWLLFGYSDSGDYGSPEGKEAKFSINGINVIAELMEGQCDISLK